MNCLGSPNLRLLDRLSPRVRPLPDVLDPPSLLNRLSSIGLPTPHNLSSPEVRLPQTQQDCRVWVLDLQSESLNLETPPKMRSLLERTIAVPPSRSSNPSSLSSETAGSLKQRLSQESSQLSSNFLSPRSKKTKLSNSTPKSLTLSTTETNQPSLLERIGDAQSLILLNDSIASRSPTTPSTDHTQEIQMIPTVPGRSGNSLLSTSLGTNPTIGRSSPCPLVASKPVSAWEFTSRTSQGAETKSKSRLEPLGASPSPSGNKF